MGRIAEIQEEVKVWALHNFGQQPSHRPAMGMGEELCELFEALSEVRVRLVEDAIGDVAIYMLNYCVYRDWPLEEIWEARPQHAPQPSVIRCLRNVLHHHLKGEQNIRGGTEAHDTAMMYTLGEILCLLEKHAALSRKSFMQVLEETWAVVKLRDWKKNPDTAAQVADEMAELGKHVDMESPVSQPGWVTELSAATQREIDGAILGPEFVTNVKGSNRG